MDLPPLVRTLLSLLIPLLQSYLEWSRAQPRTLLEREERLRRLCREICAVLLCEDARADELRVRPGLCECGGRFQSRGQRKRTLVTTVGEVIYRRRYYECEKCRAHRLPVDEAWEIESGCLSPAARSLAVDLASALPFREARRWLEHLGGIVTSLSTLWRVTQKAGARQVEAWEAHQEERKSLRGAAKWQTLLGGAGASGKWAIGVDGWLLRIDRQWREVKVGVVAPISETGRWLRGRMSYTASVEEAEEFRHQVVWHAFGRGITRKTKLAILSDGAAWIQALGTRHYPQAMIIRDFWHAVEYLWRAAQAIYGEEAPEAEEKARRWARRLKAGKVDAIRRYLVWLEKHRPIRRAEDRETYRKAVTYLDGHREAMAYASYREERWPIGSGPVEATCKMFQVRMKRPGSNWSQKGAQHMLFLRADYCSRFYSSLYPLS